MRFRALCLLVMSGACVSLDRSHPLHAQTTGINVGDTVVVSVDRTELRRGDDRVGFLQRDQRFQVDAISRGGQWLRGTFRSGGVVTQAWVSTSHVKIVRTPPRPQQRNGNQLPPSMLVIYSSTNLRPGDTVVVGTDAGLPAYFAGEPLKLDGREYRIPADTRLEVEKIIQTDNDEWIYTQVSIGADQVGAWVPSPQLIPLQRYLAGETRVSFFNPQRFGATSGIDMVKPYIPRMVVDRDFRGKLYGTMPIQQGFTLKNVAEFNGFLNGNPPGGFGAGNLQAIQKQISQVVRVTMDAARGFDLSTQREQRTKTLLASLQRLERPHEFADGLQAWISHAPAPVEVGRQLRFDEIQTLRRQGRYKEALPVAEKLTNECKSRYGEDSLEHRETQRLLETLQRISALPGDAQREISEADALSQKIVECLRTDRFGLARACAHQQYATRRQYLGPNHVETLSALAWVCSVRRMSFSLHTEDLHHDYLRRVDASVGKDHPFYVVGLNNLALLRADRADFEAAKPILREAIATTQSRSKRPSLMLPLLLYNLAHVLEADSEHDSGLKLAAVARAASRKLSATDSRIVVESLLDECHIGPFAGCVLAPLSMRFGLAYRPGRGSSGNRGVNIPGYANLDMRTMLHSYKNLLDKKTAEFYQENTEKHNKLAQEALFPLLDGDFATAERLLRESWRLIQQKHPDGDSTYSPYVLYRSVPRMLAGLLEATGNREEAAPIYAELVRWDRIHLRQSIKHPEPGAEYTLETKLHSLADVSLILARLQIESGRENQAEILLNDLVADIEAVEKSQHGRMQFDMGIFRGVHRTETQACVARIAIELGETNRGEELFRDSVAEMFRQWGLEASPRANIGTLVSGNNDAWESLRGLGELLLSKDIPSATAEAGPMLRDALLLKAIEPGPATDLARYALPYAAYLRRVDRLAESALVLQDAIRQVEEVRGQVGGDELNRARFFSNLTRRDPFSAMVRVQLAAGDRFSDSFGVGEFGSRAALNYLERGRGRALLDLLGRRSTDVETLAATVALRRSDAELQSRVRQLAEQRKRAVEEKLKLQKRRAQFQSNPASIASNPAAIQEIDSKLKLQNEAERLAQRGLFDVARLEFESRGAEPLSAGEIASSLQPGEILLAYDVGDNDTVLLALTADGNVESFELKWSDGTPVGRDDLAATVGRYFEYISEEQLDDPVLHRVKPRKAADLREALLPESLQQRFFAAKRVFVLPDGALHRIPFEALWPDTAPALAYGPSGTLLTSQRRRAGTKDFENRRQLVAVGDPVFSRGNQTVGSGEPAIAVAAQRKQSAERFGKLAPLPGTRVEIGAIASQFQRKGIAEDAVAVLTGEAATVANFFNLANQPRYVHLATHGLAEGGLRAHESALAFTVPRELQENDFGFLRLSDLMYNWGSKLDGTELVTLSACRSARGDLETGDGFVALTWGFLFAGARSVVASLWNVDDTATALLMTRFYENLLGGFDEPRRWQDRVFQPGTGMPKAEALREAKEWLRTLSLADAKAFAKQLDGSIAIAPIEHPFEAPFYWAAFVLIGDPD